MLVTVARENEPFSVRLLDWMQVRNLMLSRRLGYGQGREILEIFLQRGTR